MMAWALDTHHRDLFRDRLPFEEAIIVTGAGESDLLDVMNAVVRDYPELRLSSLPTWSGTGARVIELAVRGDAARVATAMAWVRAEIAKQGYAVAERPASPARSTA
jgi:molybdopterin-biosynthesis enzyme MoeA-like protein